MIWFAHNQTIVEWNRFTIPFLSVILLPTQNEEQKRKRKIKKKRKRHIARKTLNRSSLYCTQGCRFLALEIGISRHTSTITRCIVVWFFLSHLNSVHVGSCKQAELPGVVYPSRPSHSQVRRGGERIWGMLYIYRERESLWESYHILHLNIVIISCQHPDLLSLKILIF